jgi:hypothetical protein
MNTLIMLALMVYIISTIMLVIGVVLYVRWSKELLTEYFQMMSGLIKNELD